MTSFFRTGSAFLYRGTEAYNNRLMVTLQSPYVLTTLQGNEYRNVGKKVFCGLQHKNCSFGCVQ